MNIATLDDRHLWSWVPIVAEDGRADLDVLTAVLDAENLVVGEHGWILMYDVVHPVLALTESRRLHFGGSSSSLPEDPWMAVGRVLFIADAVKHSII